MSISFTLPHVADLRTPYTGAAHPLHKVMDILIEPSPTLESIVPTLHTYITAEGPSQPQAYSDLIAILTSLVMEMPPVKRAGLLAGHPAIGEKKKVSALSAKEQRQDEAVDVVLLERLSQLNLAYETKYPGLRYITFVNGRTRGQIAEEMEGVLGLSPAEPVGIDTICPFSTSNPEWQSELNRAIHALMAIALDRANKHLPKD